MSGPVPLTSCVVVALALVMAPAAAAGPAAGGRQIWVAAYNGSADDSDVGLAVAVAPGGSKLFVAGDTGGANGWSDSLIVAYSASTGRSCGPAATTAPAI